MAEPKKQKSATDTYAALITSIAGALGILVSLENLDIERSWRLVAVLLGVAGIGTSLASLRIRHRRPAMVTGIVLLAGAGAVLVLSPPVKPPRPPVASAEIELSDLQVTGGDVGPVTVDVTVHNTGRRRAVITGLRLTIDHFAYLPTCFTEGEVLHGAPYPLTMPDHPAPGTVVPAHLHEQVGPDRVDRFVVKIAAPPFRDAHSPYASGGGTFVYRVGLSITSDAQSPVDAGGAVFAVPFNPGYMSAVWNLDDPKRAEALREIGFTGDDLAFVSSCLDTNSRNLKTLLRLKGKRPESITQGFTGP